jgi:AbrB family looped-hinge helix DNA binding protein
VAHLVGSKGQVVITKEIRDRLGVKAGWMALQTLVDDHVEVYFVPPEHNESLKGSLARYRKRRVGLGDEWREAVEEAWTSAMKDKFGDPEADD